MRCISRMFLNGMKWSTHIWSMDKQQWDAWVACFWMVWNEVHWNRYSWPYYLTNHKRNTENKKNGIQFTVWIVRHGEDPQTPRVVGHWFQSVVLYPWLAGTYIERWGKFSLWWARKTKTQYIGIGIPGRIISRTTRETQKTKKTESNLPCG